MLPNAVLKVQPGNWSIPVGHKSVAADLLPGNFQYKNWYSLNLPDLKKAQRLHQNTKTGG